nr:pyridoxal-phosphate dependent enzyme [Mycolicibacter sp. MU0102]
MKTFAPDVEVICVQPAWAPAMTQSGHQRRAVTTDSTDTIADAVTGRFPLPAVLSDLLLVADDAVLVREASHRWDRMLLEHAGLVVEPAAALGLVGTSGGSPEVLLTFWHGFGADQLRDGRRFKSCRRDRGQRVGRR